MGTAATGVGNGPPGCGVRLALDVSGADIIADGVDGGGEAQDTPPLLAAGTGFDPLPLALPLALEAGIGFDPLPLALPPAPLAIGRGGVDAIPLAAGLSMTVAMTVALPPAPLTVGRGGVDPLPLAPLPLPLLLGPLAADPLPPPPPSQAALVRFRLWALTGGSATG